MLQTIGLNEGVEEHMRRLTDGVCFKISPRDRIDLYFTEESSAFIFVVMELLSVVE